MESEPMLHLALRDQELRQDAGGHSFWKSSITMRTLPADRLAIILCDLWDRHWSRGAEERVGAMAPRVNTVLAAARAKGAHIIHAPSETMGFYEGTPARRRMQDLPRVEPPAPLEHPDPPLPIDDSDGGSDTGEKPWYAAWTRQHPMVEIDQERDGISDSGPEIYSYLAARGIEDVAILGVHTNMCVLHRSFGIKQLVRWGLKAMLVRDLTDAMYNPAMPPYVNHDEGTRLVVEFIEKFWCPTLESRNLL